MPFNNKKPLMPGYLKSYQQYPKTIDYENQWNTLFQKNIGEPFVP